MADVWGWVMSWPEGLRYLLMAFGGMAVFIVGCMILEAIEGPSSGVGGGSAGSMREK